MVILNLIMSEDALKAPDVFFIDVRSPIEYKESAIPGAVNLPLFDNEERERIGSLYKENKDLAYEKGFEIGTSKLYSIFKEIKLLQLSKDTKIIIYCWRGGLRSKSVAINLNMMGINAFQLKGGYKAYRKYIREGLKKFENKFSMINLHGNTGVGKTILLKNLEKKGFPILDLEGFANNRGSIFGSVGLGEPLSQKMFDSLLYNKLSANDQDYFFIESESKRIGNVTLPDFLVSSMKKAQHILIKTDIDTRIKNITKEYLPLNNKEQIKKLILNNKFIHKKMGHNWVDILIAYLEKDDYYNFIRMLLLDYYDPLYSFSQKKYEPFHLEIDVENYEKATKKLIKSIKES